MQPHVGELYENPVTGERGVVRVPPRQSNGQLLVVDLYVPPGGAVAGEQVHPAATETVTVVRGELAVRRDGRDPPTVTPEPLPAEIAQLIPGLAARPRWPNTTTVAAGR